MVGNKSQETKKVYTIGAAEVTDVKQITIPMMMQHVKSLGKEDVKWLIDTMKTEVEKTGKDGKPVKRLPSYIDVRNAFAREYFPELAPKGTSKKLNTMKEAIAELESFLEE